MLIWSKLSTLMQMFPYIRGSVASLWQLHNCTRSKIIMRFALLFSLAVFGALITMGTSDGEDCGPVSLQAKALLKCRLKEDCRFDLVIASDDCGEYETCCLIRVLRGRK